MICKNGKISLYCFSITAGIFLLLLCANITYSSLFEFKYAYFLAPAFYFIAANVVLRFIYSGYSYQIAIRASLLGFVLGTGIYIIFFGSNNVRVFGVYMCVLAVFHYSEFLAIAIIQPNLVSIDSFVINHSVQYTVAAVVSWLEFFLEWYFWPEMKTITCISTVGFCMCVGGELLRKSAMLTAKSNFNHLVQFEKTDDHTLVTHGVYSLCRHPSYVGWFYWSIGTQIILQNPFCILAYTAASWTFFRERIMFEEITLIKFFGQQYCEYQDRVGTGIPFIKGYKIKF